MSSPIHQYVVNLVVSLTIRGGPGVFMNVPVREHRALNNQIHVLMVILCYVIYAHCLQYNKLLLNSSMKATCFGLKNHHQAIKYMELFRNLQDLTSFYKALSNRLALNCIYLILFVYTVVS